MEKISLCMIVRDNEKDMERLLPKIKDSFDEMVIVDTGSKDKTKEIAKKYGANVYDFKWINDFSAARNFSFDKATNEWVFWLDSDDDITGHEKLRGLTDMADDKTAGFAFVYNYARDEYGNIVAIHWRERLLKKSQFKWVGQIHETAIQNTKNAVMKTEDVVVDHLATLEELQGSLQRNLDILLKDQSDSRTLYYIGQTYRGMKEFKKAAEYYVKYIQVSGWEEEKMHAWHYLGECMTKTGDFQEAIIANMEAIKLRPNWPDGYFGVANTYFHMADQLGGVDNWKYCIEWIKNGFTKKIPETIRVIEPHTYTWIPLLQMAICKLSIGEVDEAYTDYIRAYKMSNGAEFVARYIDVFKEMKEKENDINILSDFAEMLEKNDKSKLKEIGKVIPKSISDDPRVISIRHAYSDPKVWDNKEIAIFCAFSYEEWAAPSVLKGIGGSEEAVINLSREFVRLGYKVTVYNHCGSLAGIYDGVEYKNTWELNIKDDFNIFISWRNHLSFLNGINAKHKWVWLHDVPESKDYTQDVIDSFDKIVVLSDFHRSLLPQIPDEKVLISNNGINPEHFKNLPEKKDNTIFWGSSYDRGLYCLLKDIMPLVWEEVPEAKLNICYGWNTFDEMNKGNKNAMAWKDAVVKMMSDKRITHHGRVSHKKVAELMGESTVWAYSTEFDEINCITLQKCQCAGCVPVTTDVAALKERNIWGTLVKGGDIYTNKKLQKKFSDEVVKQLKDPNKIPTDEAIKKFSWSETAKQWSNQWTSRS